MTGFALLLVLIAAVLHAVWNFCAKRAGGGLPFVWLVGACICTGYIPVLAFYFSRHSVTVPPHAVAWILGSGVLKTSYSLFLQRGYRHGDFSLIYPLARGTGPLLSTLAAIAFLGERPSGIALVGGSVIIASIFWLTGGVAAAQSWMARRPETLTASSTGATVERNLAFTSVGYGVISGVFIASYTLWDQRGVSHLAIAPLLYDAGTAFTQLALLTPFALKRWPEVKTDWRTKKHWAIGVAALSPVAYVLVLTAMKVTPVSYVAPAREVSIVIGAFIGAKFLREAEGRRRLLAAIAMAGGVIALALG